MVKNCARAHSAFGVRARNPEGHELRGWLAIAPPNIPPALKRSQARQLGTSRATPGRPPRSPRLSRSPDKGDGVHSTRPSTSQKRPWSAWRGPRSAAVTKTSPSEQAKPCGGAALATRNGVRIRTPFSARNPGLSGIEERSGTHERSNATLPTKLGARGAPHARPSARQSSSAACPELTA